MDWMLTWKDAMGMLLRKTEHTGRVVANGDHAQTLKTSRWSRNGKGVRVELRTVTEL